MGDDHPDWQDGIVKVVKNHEAICSIWPADRENPAGWEDIGVSGTKQECLDYIKANCDANCRLLPERVEGNVEGNPDERQDDPPSEST